MKNTYGKLIKKLPLRFIMFISYFSIIIVITSIASIVYYYNSVNSSIENTNKYVYSMLNEMGNRLDLLVSGITSLSYGISQDDDLLYYLRKFKGEEIDSQISCQKYIDDIINNYWKLKSEVLNITVYIPDMKYIGTVHNSIYPIEQIKNQDWFKPFEGTNGVLIESHYLSGYSTNPIECVTAMTKINGLGTKYEGYVTVNVDENDIYNILDNNKASENSFMYVVNNQGIIVSGRIKTELGKMFQDTDILNKILEKGSGEYMKERIQGDDYLVVYSDINRIGWRVIEYIPTDELYTGLERIKGQVLTIILLSLLFALPLSIYLSQYIAKPIINLSSVMSHFGKNSRNKKVATEFTNEIGELHTSYNKMLDKIDELISDIQRYNDYARQSEIKLLQAQINPHLLYNMLDSISWNALNKGAPEISSMVSMLSKYYRLSLNKGQSICTVFDEVSNVKYYMEIQKLCFNNSFEYVINVDEETEDLFIPKLILQPIVENSIVHGFERKKCDGKIKINVYVSNEKLFMEVEDNGKGVSDEFLSRIITFDSKRGGYGVRNVNERIQFICGEEYGLSYSHGTEGGTVVKITLPLMKK